MKHRLQLIFIPASLHIAFAVDRNLLPDFIGCSQGFATNIWTALKYHWLFLAFQFYIQQVVFEICHNSSLMSFVIWYNLYKIAINIDSRIYNQGSMHSTVVYLQILSLKVLSFVSGRLGLPGALRHMHLGGPLQMFNEAISELKTG